MGDVWEGYTVADRMRFSLERIGLVPTARGATMAGREHQKLARDIEAALPRLLPADLFSVYVIVISLAGDGEDPPHPTLTGVVRRSARARTNERTNERTE